MTCLCEATSEEVLKVKSFLRWAILACTLAFIVREVVQHGQAVAALRLTHKGALLLGWAGLVTLAAHLWAGWVWHWLLQLWQQPGRGRWAMRVYMHTNLHKYLPGNIWHFYGRLRAVQGAGGSLRGAAASVAAEPLLMAVAAVGIGAVMSAVANGLSAKTTLTFEPYHWGGGWVWMGGLFGLWAIALTLLHPRLLNPRLRQMSKLKLNKLTDTLRSSHKPGKSPIKSVEMLVTDGPTGSVATAATAPIASAVKIEVGTSAEEKMLQLNGYPLKPLLGEMGFVLVRSLGFVLTVMALAPVGATDLPTLVAGFSLAWVAGLVVPGAPGGIGVFETVAIALLNGLFSPALILGSVACYRLVSTLAEVAGAAGIWLYRKVQPVSS